MEELGHGRGLQILERRDDPVLRSEPRLNGRDRGCDTALLGEGRFGNANAVELLAVELRYAGPVLLSDCLRRKGIGQDEGIQKPASNPGRAVSGYMSALQIPSKSARMDFRRYGRILE